MADLAAQLPGQKVAAAFDVECSNGRKHRGDSLAPNSAHTTDHDSWLQVGVLLVTGFTSGYVLSYSSLILRPLGWLWGSLCMAFIAFFSLYGNCLLAELNAIDGRRFIRYRDLMGYVFGRKMYYTTYVLQYSMLVLGNMGFIMLAAKSLKEINLAFDASALRLQVYIVITGAVYFIFSVLVPTMSAMREWLGLSVLLTLAYIGTVTATSVKDGMSNSVKSYHVDGSTAGKIFNAFGAVSAIVVSHNSGLLPEMQSTLRRPAVKNMKAALLMQFTVGLPIYYGVTVIGYWAYGAEVSAYLPEQISGPKWAKVLANLAMFVQSVVSQHMFLTPVHETLDTMYLNPEESLWSYTNMKRRSLLRAIVFAVNSFVVAMFPFMGDFVNLLGSFALLPLSLVFPSMIFIKVKGRTASFTTKAWHWLNIILFSIFTILTTVSAVRLIIENVRIYHFFANT
ncbi:probable proline transporter 2 isoform X2 [Nymphaea colorata]|uniref:probable proline transporter 2 isoform X2 n=1 Tax=Nymphaea colorata TaxID=210225 RepID=UPI00129ED071|nr:probable proline transporter 2 isoform X2 [Nymphaea colorata]